MFFSDSESSMPTMQTSVEVSIEAITSGVKPGGVSTITKSCIARSTRVDLAQELDRDDARLVGPRRREQRADARRSASIRKPSSFSASSEPPGLDEVVDRALRAQAERRARRRRTAGRGRRARRCSPRIGERDREVASTSASCRCRPSGPSTQIERRRRPAGRGRRALPAGEHLLQREPDLLRLGRKRDRILGAGLEDAAQIAVGQVVGRAPRPAARGSGGPPGR